METKICCRCNEEKTIDDFLWRNKDKGIKHCQCRICYKQIRKKNYDTNKQYYLDKNKRIKKRNTEWYKNYKNNLSCEKCGESHIACLDFHHKNEKEKLNNVSIMRATSFSIEKIKEEIGKCVVLCANCHRKHHYEERYGLIV